VSDWPELRAKSPAAAEPWHNRNRMIGLISFLWLCIWSGLFSDLSNLGSPRLFSNPVAFIQGMRSIAPLLAGFIGILLLVGSGRKIALFKNTLGFLLAYCLIGLLSSLFMSPDIGVALYWGGMYLSPLLVVLFSEGQENALDCVRRLTIISYAVIFILFLFCVPQTLDMVRGRMPFTQFFEMPFGIGQVRVNGVGRYALIVAIVSFIRLNFARKKTKVFWIGFVGMALIMMAYTRSRTTLLGLAVASLLFAYVQKVDWRFFVAGPVAAYVLWVSGYKWRAQQNVEKLLTLTGREYTWERGLKMVGQSPLFGWGFHSDRLLLNSEHMHNSYLHAAIHAGILGALLFAAGIISIWVLMFRSGFLRHLKYQGGPDKPFLLESVLLVGYLSSRSLFESTAAFYGVDLLVFLPAVAYILVWLAKNPDFRKT
jgi:O-antigen ligase